MIRRAPFFLAGALAALASVACARDDGAAQAGISVQEARGLDPSELATKLVGPLIGSRVIEAVRHEYGADTNVPQEVMLYTRPVLSWPRLNGICRVDVITVEYDWFEHDAVTPSTVLNIFRVEAENRYKAFPMPPGEPGSPENEKAQLAACAGFKLATDAFKAPSAGDAQWLAKVQRLYSEPEPRRAFKLMCDSDTGSSCDEANDALPRLALHLADKVESIDCAAKYPGHQLVDCYRLTFPYAGTKNPEWVLTVAAGIKNGMAPVEILSMQARRVSRPIVLY
ncbi:MAG: hypothetical protein EOP60_05985 [Sphingomonadales bacterium]|nr:MAG: hypothetical protein EOP60_05985 [Sphingomonadales bacterium]